MEVDLKDRSNASTQARTHTRTRTIPNRLMSLDRTQPGDRSDEHGVMDRSIYRRELALYIYIYIYKYIYININIQMQLQAETK